MNGIDDLRQSLDSHATNLVDDDVLVRSSAVHQRVRVVRRRRRMAGAAATVAAVAVVGAAVAVLPGGDGDGPGPANRVVGVPAPDTMTSLGYTYEFSQAVQDGDGKVSVRLEPSDQPRLVSWATSGDDDRVTVSGGSVSYPTSYDVGDFGDFAFVDPSDTSSVVKVRAADGDVGLAVYTLDASQRPEGYTARGVTYRAQVAGSHLIAADVGDPGQADLTVSATADSPGASFYSFCSSDLPQAYVHTSSGKDGPFSYGASCDRGVPLDGTTSGSIGGATKPGDDLTTRVWITDGKDGPILDDPDLRIGVGVYGDEVDPSSRDYYLAPELEDSGHTWSLTSTSQAGPDDGQVASDAPTGSGPVLVVAYTAGRGQAQVLTDFGASRQAIYVDKGQAGVVAAVVEEGQHVVSGLDEGTTADLADLTLGFYVRAE